MFEDFPFRETYLQNAQGQVKKNSLLLATIRALSEVELVAARGGESIEEQASVESDEKPEKKSNITSKTKSPAYEKNVIFVRNNVRRTYFLITDLS